MKELIKDLGKKYIETGLLTQSELAKELKMTPQRLGQVLSDLNISLDHKYLAMLEIESEGYTLMLGRDKINSVGEIFYVQCPLGHIYKTNLTEWRRGRRCQFCAKERLEIVSSKAIEVNAYVYIHNDSIIELGWVLDGTIGLYIDDDRKDKHYFVYEGTLDKKKDVLDRIRKMYPDSEIVDDDSIDKIRDDGILIKIDSLEK